MAYGISHERVRQVIRNTVAKLWLNLPEQEQRLFPLDQMEPEQMPSTADLISTEQISKWLKEHYGNI